ncbi:DNA-directed RNA polymerase I subunit RPA43 [Spathaspora sp. JA1]|nr:DNA-directed RNA polymerase I subunit RPA43 [Spathaspora sp. JA1]
MSVEVRKRPRDNSTPVRSKLEPPKSTNPIDETTQLSQPFKTITTSLYVSLAPMYINDPITGIKTQHLDQLVMTYFPKAQGVVIGYSNIKLDNSEQVKIEGSSPFTFMWINVDFLVWSPQIGDVLQGDIYMSTASHLGLLICDTFNCSIKKYGIPRDWRFVPIQQDEFEEEEAGQGRMKNFGYWVDENEVKVEGKLTFTVKALHTTGRVVSIEGTLIQPGQEISAQPVRTGTSKHMKFDDGDEQVSQEEVVSVDVVVDEDDEQLPGYIINSDEEKDEDQAVVVNNEEDSEEVESD